MPRFKQVVQCECGHRAWREVDTPTVFHPEPDRADLERRAKCSKCGERGKVRVWQENIGARWNDAFLPGGARAQHVVTFENCHERDAERREAIEQRNARRSTPATCRTKS